MLARSLLSSLVALAIFCQPGYTKKRERVPISPKILQAKSVFLDCDCRKEMAGSVRSALPEVLDWGRYQLARDRNHADLIFLFSMNPYLGDYFTRDGPDRRPAIVDYTILTVIDGHTAKLCGAIGNGGATCWCLGRAEPWSVSCAWLSKDRFTWIPNRPRDEKFVSRTC